MPAQQQGQHFVTQLLIAHAKAGLLVSCGEQHRQQIVRIRVCQLLSPLIDEGVDDGVERIQPGQQTAIAWSRDPERWERKRGVPGDEGIQRGERAPDPVHLSGEIVCEEGQSGNAQRQAHHLLRDVQRCITWIAALPALQHRGRRLTHQPTEAGQPFVMKGRLHEASLVQPGLSIVGEESIAEDLLGRLHHGKVFTVVAMILLEDALHLIRVIEHIGWPEQEAEVSHVTIPLPDVKGKADGVALERCCVGQWRKRARTRGSPGTSSWRRFRCCGDRVRHR